MTISCCQESNDEVQICFNHFPNPNIIINDELLAVLENAITEYADSAF